MEEIITGLETDAANLEERSENAAQKQVEADNEIAKLKEEINNNKGADSVKQKEVSGLKELSDDMSELRNKWVKEVDRKNIDAVTKSMALNNDAVHTFIMDSLAVFFSGSADATYQENQA